MYNPETHTVDDVRSLLKAVYQEFPKARRSLSRFKKTPCDVCKGGALLLYSVRQGFVDPDELLRVSNMGDAPEDDDEPWFDQRPDDDGVINREWRFPPTDILEVVLIRLNTRLANTPEAAMMASNIVHANDAGDFKKAERLIEQALCWPNA